MPPEAPVTIAVLLSDMHYLSSWSWVPNPPGEEQTFVILPAIRALPNKCKRDGIPLATVFPCPSSLIASLLEKASNALICELIAILGVNGFAWHEVKIKVCVLDTYMLLSRALKVHLDPRFNGIPDHAMTEASGVKVRLRVPY